MSENIIAEAAKGNVTREDDLPVFTPHADVYETPEALWIRCDLPGVSEDELEITLERKELTISGRQMSQGRVGFEPVAAEYRTGIYQRSFHLNREVDEASVKARLRNGVLDLEIPKSPDARPRRIPISGN